MKALKAVLLLGLGGCASHVPEFCATELNCMQAEPVFFLLPQSSDECAVSFNEVEHAECLDKQRQLQQKYWHLLKVEEQNKQAERARKASSETPDTHKE